MVSVTFETDSAVDYGFECWCALDDQTLIEDIRVSLHKFEDATVVGIDRDANKAADLIVKLQLQRMCPMDWILVHRPSFASCCLKIPICGGVSATDSDIQYGEVNE